jgi:hypothetical protein
VAIGWFGEGVFDWIGGRVSDAGDAFSEVAAVVPFAPELGGALKDVINGPLRDFARTPYGLAVLRAMSTTIYGPLAWTIGPQVASLAFALPGVVRGDDFLEAWLTEVQWRAEKTAETLAPGASAALTPKIQEAAAAMTKMLPEEVRSLALSELAARLQVDEWTAAMARWFLAQIPMPPRDAFDPVTGALRRYTSRSVSVEERTRSSLLASWAVRQAPVDERMRSTSFAHLFGGGGVAPSSAAVATTAPDEPAPRPRTSTAGNVALIGLIGLAGASLVWFYSGDKS